MVPPRPGTPKQTLWTTALGVTLTHLLRGAASTCREVAQVQRRESGDGPASATACLRKIAHGDAVSYLSMTTSLSGRYRFGAFELQPDERRLLLAGDAVRIGRHGFDLLVVMVERKGRLIGKDELLERVWPGLVLKKHAEAQVSALRGSWAATRSPPSRGAATASRSRSTGSMRLRPPHRGTTCRTPSPASSAARSRWPSSGICSA